MTARYFEMSNNIMYGLKALLIRMKSANSHVTGRYDHAGILTAAEFNLAGLVVHWILVEHHVTCQGQGQSGSRDTRAQKVTINYG